MIPLPPLLVLACDPLLEGATTCDRDLTDGYQNGSEIIAKPLSEAENNKSRNDDSTRKRAAKRQRRKMGTSVVSTTPNLPPAPLRFRRVRKTDPPRYRDVVVGFHPRAPFWERQQREEKQNRSPGRQTVASIRRHSQLCTFLVTLASFVAVDEYTLLPSFGLLYVVALSVAWESWMDEAEENVRYLEKLKQYHNKLQTIEKEVQKAQFEYHVLRNQPHIDIVALQRKKKKRNSNDPEAEASSDNRGSSSFENFDPDDDHWIVFADESKSRRQQSQPPRPRPRPRPHQEQTDGPPTRCSSSKPETNKQPQQQPPIWMLVWLIVCSVVIIS